jgi:hypothetical protein
VSLRTVIAAIAAVPLVLGTVAANDDPDPTPVHEGCSILEGSDTEGAEPVLLCEDAFYGSCSTAAGGKLYVPAVDQIPLVDDAPAQSFTAGAGCGTIDEPVFGSTGIGGTPNYEYFTQGFVSFGNLDTLTFELHFLGPNLGYAGEELRFDARVIVDGISLFGDDTFTSVTGDVVTSPARKRIVATPVVSSTGASSSVRFTITGISELAPSLFARPGEAGAAPELRQVQLQFTAPTTTNCSPLPPNNSERCVPAGASPLVLGATEIPTGGLVNLADTDAFGVEVPAGKDA